MRPHWCGKGKDDKTMTKDVVFLVDDKEKMIQELTGLIDTGNDYAAKCAATLVSDFGADLQLIDIKALTESATGKVIDCAMRGSELPPVVDYLNWLIDGRSAYGLAKLGL